jgi:hypothetical protein
LKHGILSRWSLRAAVCALGITLLLGTACGPQAKEKASSEADLVRTPTAEADPNVSLNISVGLVSGRVLFENKSGETLRNILVVMTEWLSNDLFQHTIGTVPAFAIMHFTPRVFRNGSGTGIDPTVHKIKDITVYADISSGRGRWYGSY